MLSLLFLALAADPCQEASARLGKRVCVTSIADRSTWNTLTIGSRIHWTRYLLPASSKARLPALVVDAHTFELHQDLLKIGFPSLFPGLDASSYAQLLYNPRVREFYAGNLIEHPKTGIFGFTLEEVESGPVGEADLSFVRDALKTLVPFTELQFEPSPPQQARHLGGTATVERSYEVYSEARAFGVVRRVKAREIPEDLSRSDVVILDAAPFDLEAPVAAAITSVPTAQLSHLSVRSAARGTPACFVENAWETLAVWEGKRVEVRCGEKGLQIRAATAEEALAWEQGRRPVPVTVALPDPQFSELVDLPAMPGRSSDERALGLRRFGSKGRNLALLVQRIPAEWTVEGFLIPFSAYLKFMEQPWEGRSFRETIQSWDRDPEYNSSAAVRRTRLAALRRAMEEAPVDPAVLSTLSQKLQARFGSRTMVRFRSSSNAEDSLRFPGAGLYRSVSVCLGDDQDGDGVGPSVCDPETSRERGVADGLRKVWASLWNERAVEERRWYGIPTESVAMGVLVDPRAAKEQANIVAFSGAPNGKAGDATAFLVEAQAGEAEVVSTDPGMWPEQVRLVMARGEVASIQRLRPSSLAAQVLSDAQLRELGRRLARIADVFPVDEAAPAGHDQVLDTEWKVLADGRLIIKQVRPFLR